MDKDGVSVHDHLRQVEEATGTTPPELEPPPFPYELQYIWEWYIEIQKGRSSSGMGIDAIGWSVVESWCRLTGTCLWPDEIRLIIDIDHVYRRVMVQEKQR